MASANLTAQNATVEVVIPATGDKWMGATLETTGSHASAAVIVEVQARRDGPWFALGCALATDGTLSSALAAGVARFQRLAAWFAVRLRRTDANGDGCLVTLDVR